MPNPRLVAEMWNRTIDMVDMHNQPGVFTAFHGFEWTSTPVLRNLHRVVIFRDDADAARSVVPFSSFDLQDPEDLWDYLEMYEERTLGRALAIPHNGNLSQGLMFAVETFDGEPLDADYARRRQQWEPLAEVTQTKGDGEAHPMLSPNDEFADYYTWDKGDFGLNPKTPEMLPHEYARSALKLGLQQEAEIGVNPFKFGMIGATDIHTSLSTTREENFFGKFVGAEPSSEHRYSDLVSQDLRPDGDGSLDVFAWESTSSGACCRLGEGKHAGGHLGRDVPEGGLCHDWHPDQGSGLRWMGFRTGRGASAGLFTARLSSRCSDGRGPSGGTGRCCAEIPGARAS